MTDVSTAGPATIPRGGTMRRAAIVASMILVLLAAGAALFLVRTVDTQLTDAATTDSIRRQAREVQLDLVQAESGQRGYLITKDEAYLEPYKAASASIGSAYLTLLDMVKSSPDRTAAIQGLGPDIEAKQAEMAQTISLLDAGKGAEALAMIRSDEGQNLMAEITDRIQAFVAQEDQKLVERNSQVEAYRQGLVAAVLLALGAAAVLASALFTRSQQQVAALAERQSALLLQTGELEAHVRQRTAEVEEARARAERERQRLELLLQDTNHRIGNSLATVSSLLGLQVARTNSAEVKTALEAAQSRVHAIASGHRRLRLGADLETTNASEFLEAVVDDLGTTLTADMPVKLHKDFDPFVIPARDATTIGIIVGELVTNALKHAFAGRSGGEIWVHFKAPESGPVLSVEDDGNGISGERQESGLGTMIVKQLARQFGGEPEYAPRPAGGTIVVVGLPKLVQAPD